MNNERLCISVPVDEYRDLIRMQRDMEILKVMLLSYRDERFGVSRNELESICNLFCDNKQTDESW